MQKGQKPVDPADDLTAELDLLNAVPDTDADDIISAGAELTGPGNDTGSIPLHKDVPRPAFPW